MSMNRVLFFAILLFGGLTTKSAVALSLVSGAGLCLDVHAPDQFNDGGRVQVWECNNSQQQIWSFVNGTLQSGAGLCLDVHAPDQFDNGGRVQVWGCNNSQQQTWSFVNGTLQSGAGLCLDVHAPDQFNDGGRVQVWRCNNSQQQKWLPRGPGIAGPAVTIPPTFVRPLPRPQQSPRPPPLFPLPEIARQTPTPPVLRLPQPAPGNIRCGRYDGPDAAAYGHRQRAFRRPCAA